MWEDSWEGGKLARESPNWSLRFRGGRGLGCGVDDAWWRKSPNANRCAKAKRQAAGRVIWRRAKAEEDAVPTATARLANAPLRQNAAWRQTPKYIVIALLYSSRIT